MIHLTEDILQFAWKNSLYDFADLLTTDGQPIDIISKGELNKNSGPDINNATIKIGETTWAGNVEIHIHSSDWYLHKHQNDEAYNNVVLHVVYFHDKDVFINNQCLPVLELKNRIPPSLFRKYKLLLKKEDEIPCRNIIREIKSTTILNQLESSLRQRFIRKSQEVLQVFYKSKNDWEETTFQLLLRSFVGKINQQPAEWLGEKVNLKLLRNAGDSLVAKEALLAGLGGWLDKAEDDYSKQLSKEYGFLKVKYNLQELNPAIWKTGRMRPAQFPIFRLAQLAAMIQKNNYLFSPLINDSMENIQKNYTHAEAANYWSEHCHLAKPIKKRTTKIGNMQQELILINVAAPILFAYGNYIQNDFFKNKAIALLQSIKSENNNIIKKWQKLAVQPASAFESQALIELYNGQCIRKKCLSCIIGMQILKS